MKKILILLALPLASLAQKTFFIRPVVGYGNTMLYNKEDTKKAKNTSSAGTNPIPMQTTTSPNFGMQFGIDFNKSKAGLQAVSIGIGYTPFKQKYKGYLLTSVANYKNQIATVVVKLNYINVPLLAEFNLSKIHKITPIASVGINLGYLTSYDLDAFGLPYFTNTATTYKRNIHNKSISSTVANDPYSSYTGTIDKWYYKKTAISSQIGFGAKMQLNNKLEFQLLLTNNYSFGDVENKKDITYTTTNAGNNNISITTFKPYVQNYSYMCYRDYYAHGTVRPASHLIQTGLQLGLTYKLPTKNK